MNPVLASVLIGITTIAAVSFFAIAFFLVVDLGRYTWETEKLIEWYDEKEEA